MSDGPTRFVVEREADDLWTALDLDKPGCRGQGASWIEAVQSLDNSWLMYVDALGDAKPRSTAKVVWVRR